MADIAGSFSTESSYDNMEITWKLRDFLRISENKNCLVSPSFSLAGAGWQLELYPYGGSRISSKGVIDIFLKRLNYSSYQRVKTTFSLKNRDGKNCRSYYYDIVYTPNLSYWGKSIIKRSQLEKEHYSLLPDGTLTVQCQIRVEQSTGDSEAPEYGSSETDSTVEQVGPGALHCQQLDSSPQIKTSDACKGASGMPRTSPSVQKLQVDYKKLLERGEGTDVCLKVSDKEFRAHKCILTARSSVFSAMFKYDTKERNSGEVVIEDLDPESFLLFLQHVYAGSVDTLSEENVFNLYTAADKYGMADLKAECKSYMERTLSVDTFCDVIFLALLYKEEELLKVAIDFYCMNLTKIIVTVKWQMFSKQHNSEANELFIKALDNLSDENVFNLYVAADKYDMVDLKSECRRYMEGNLSVGIFCDVMILALRYKEDGLLKIANDFFGKNLKKIILTVEWWKFMSDHSEEANGLLIKHWPADRRISDLNDIHLNVID